MSSKKCCYIYLFSILLLTIFPTAVRADVDADRVVNVLLQNYGGKDYINGLHGVRLMIAGEILNPWQSRGSTGVSPISTSHEYAFDWENSNEIATTDFNFPGGHRVVTSELKTKMHAQILDLTTGNVTNSSEHYRLQSAFKLHPMLILRELAREGVKVRTAGELRYRHVLYDVLSIETLGGSNFDILMAKGEERIAGVRYKSWAADKANTFAIQIFTDPEKEAPFFPSVISGSIESSFPQSWSYRVTKFEINPKFAREEFGVQFVQGEAKKKPNGVVKRLANNMYLVQGFNDEDYNSLVVEFGDFVAVVEAPVDYASGIELKRITKKLFPTKPIKYLILSHHHADHIAGASGVVEDGTIVLAPSASKHYIASVLESKIESSKNKIQALERGSKFSIVDKEMHLNVFTLEGNPHADDMLYVYFPTEKLVFQADMFFFHEPDNLSYPLNERGFAFYHSLLLKGIDFARMAGAHGVTVPRERVDTLIKTGH